MGYSPQKGGAQLYGDAQISKVSLILGNPHFIGFRSSGFRGLEEWGSRAQGSSIFRAQGLGFSLAPPLLQAFCHSKKKQELLRA